MIDHVELPAPADKIVSEFVRALVDLAPHFVQGVYLTGSISLNDFHPNKSDIDFLVLCKELPDSKVFPKLLAIHQAIENLYPYPRLSGQYFASAGIETSNWENIKALTWHESSLHYQKFEMAPVLVTELRDNAITVFGTKAAALAIPANENSLNRFLHNNINTYWRNWIKRHSSFLNRKIVLLLFPHLSEWMILGVARQLFTLHTGKIVSKTEAGLYCLQLLPAKFHPIIQEAIDIRKDDRTYPLVGSYAIRPSVTRMTQTIECVNYIIDIFNMVYNERQR